MKSVTIKTGELQIEKEWGEILIEEFKKDYFIELREFIRHERQNHRLYPDENLIYEAFNRTPFSKVNVVIIGQDPYHGTGQANGLSFSVSKGIRSPPSLLNIFKELKSDLRIDIPTHGDLGKWADQGVLLLNATLTVRAGEAGSHQKKGWEIFTDAVIRNLSAKKTGLVFLLWGKYAQSKEILIDLEKHFVLKSAHPSPLARGAFFGSKPFSKTNELLLQMGKTPINWNLAQD
jgi:uracil-DNA glycosylase